MDNPWAYAICLSLFGGLIGIFAKIIYDGVKKDKQIARLEYENEKFESGEEHKDDSPDTIIARLKSRFGWRSGPD